MSSKNGTGRVVTPKSKQVVYIQTDLTGNVSRPTISLGHVELCKAVTTYYDSFPNARDMLVTTLGNTIPLVSFNHNLGVRTVNESGEQYCVLVNQLKGYNPGNVVESISRILSHLPDELDLHAKRTYVLRGDGLVPTKSLTANTRKNSP